MALKSLILCVVALAGCTTTGELDTRVQQAAQARGEASARPPVLVLPAACTALVERVKVGDEPWVIHSWRWNVSADNRDQQARDCQAWADDHNKRVIQ